MAPALPEVARESDARGTRDLMDDDEMGLQAPDHSHDVDQILVELGGAELAQADLLQAMKSFEGDALSAGDDLSATTDTIFPLSGFDLPEPVETESDEVKIAASQARIERRCAFLIRRLRILQARSLGKRISEEVGQNFERCLKGARRDGCGRPMGLKAFLKKVETTSTLQANVASRSVSRPTYFHTGTTSTGEASRSATVGVPTGTLTGLDDTAGALRSHLTIVKHSLDSDATESSSGAESNDEDITYNNQHQRPMPIENRALWSWQVSRASLASRWVWLQLRLQELEYKLRQHTDLQKQVRSAKGPVEFEGEPPAAYEGPLPGSETIDDNDPSLETCARIRPLKRETFKKRKLLQMLNLHMATEKAANPSDISCDCSWGSQGCAVCTGRAEATEPGPAICSLPANRALARLDPAYHPVLSDIRDVTPSLHLAALSSRAWFRSRSHKSGRGAHHSTPTTMTQTQSTTTSTGKSARKHPPRLKRGRPPLSRKLRDSEADTSSERARSQSRQSRITSSYDIDNIVIPQSMAAATRPEILHYKEILTPKWRVLDILPMPLNNGFVKNNNKKFPPKHVKEEEDMSESLMLFRHSSAESAERTRYLRPRTRRSQHSDDTPLLPPPPPLLPPPSYCERVKPFSPRKFPLSDSTYSSMLSDMPQGHQSATPPGDDDAASSRSPLSPALFAADDGDDDDDDEWEPNLDRVKRKSNVFR